MNGNSRDRAHQSTPFGIKARRDSATFNSTDRDAMARRVQADDATVRHSVAPAPWSVWA